MFFFFSVPDSLLSAKIDEFLERDLACFPFTKPASVERERSESEN